MKKHKIIYIAGYGRSGSTLLARILGMHENIFVLGELVNFINMRNFNTSICSCGKEIRNCNFWSKIYEKFKNDFRNVSKMIRIQKENESILFIIKTLFLKTSKSKNIYESINKKLFNSIFQNLPKNIDYLVDSSKTTWSRFLRPYSIYSINNTEIKLIHIVRDGRGCLWSMLKGTDNGMLSGINLNARSSFPVIRTSIHWLFANIAAYAFRITHCSKHYCQIKYEDLVDKPEIAFKIIGDFLNLCFEKQLKDINDRKEVGSSHIIAGNRMRHSKTINIKPDIEWKKKLKTHQNILFLFFTWPLMIIYKYRIGHAK